MEPKWNPQSKGQYRGLVQEALWADCPEHELKERIKELDRKRFRNVVPICKYLLLGVEKYFPIRVFGNGPKPKSHLNHRFIVESDIQLHSHCPANVIMTN